MARWGSVDFRQLQNLQRNMEKLAQVDFEKFCEDSAKELAARLLAKVIKRTPVGEYKEGSGKTGGTLRRGWTAGEKHWSEKDGKTRTTGIGGATGYAQSLPVTKIGNVYQIEITNPVHYAPYVEFGHRTRDHKGWVPGKFMLTISENELDAQAPKIIKKKLMKLLGEAFDGN